MKRLIEKFERKMVDINYANPVKMDRHGLGSAEISRIEGAKVIIYIFQNYFEIGLSQSIPRVVR